MRINRSAAETILRTRGWLSHQPAAFAAEVLAHATIQHYRAGEIIYRFGDPLGGIYGLASGVIGIDAAPADSPLRRVHLGVPGFWTGEGCFLTRQPRRIELGAIVETTVLHLPLKKLDEMALRDPETIRRVAQSLMAGVDILIRIVHDLQQSDTDRRIASVLQRAGWIGDKPIPLTQTELGAMANASRKQVNAALQKFAAAAWIETSYRAITVTDAAGLRAFALGERDPDETG
jgi:CRP-like cAMP-binding protein